MAPPIGGPISGPTIAGMENHAIAVTRSDLSAARTSSRRPTGVIIAPPTPCRKRAATKASRELDMAQAREPSMKTAMAHWKTNRAPNRSAMRPEIGMKVASDT